MFCCFSANLPFVSSWELLAFNPTNLERTKVNETHTNNSCQLTSEECGFISDHAHDIRNIMKPSIRDHVSRIFCEEYLLIMVFWSFTRRCELCLKHASYWEQGVKKCAFLAPVVRELSPSHWRLNLYFASAPCCCLALYKNYSNTFCILQWSGTTRKFKIIPSAF